MRDAYFFQINARGNKEKVFKIEVQGPSILYVAAKVDEDEQQETTVIQQQETTPRQQEETTQRQQQETTQRQQQAITPTPPSSIQKRSVGKKDGFIEGLSKDGWVIQKVGEVSTSCSKKLNKIWMKTISKKGAVTTTMPQIKSDEIEGVLFVAGIILILNIQRRSIY